MLRHAIIAMSDLMEVWVTDGALDNQRTKTLEAAFFYLWMLKTPTNKHPELENLLH